MIRLKSHNGFSLIEALVALAVISVITVTVLRVQGSLTNTTSRTVNRVRITILMKNFMIDMEQQQKKEKEQLVDGPPATKLSYKLTSLKKSSDFEKIPGLFLETVTAQWTEKAERKQTFAAIVFRPQKQEQGA